MPTATKVLTIGDLEAGFATYCQALRRLVWPQLVLLLEAVLLLVPPVPACPGGPLSACAEDLETPSSA